MVRVEEVGLEGGRWRVEGGRWKVLPIYKRDLVSTDLVHHAEYCNMYVVGFSISCRVLSSISPPPRPAPRPTRPLWPYVYMLRCTLSPLKTKGGRWKVEGPTW